MLITKKLYIKAGSKNFNYFKNLGYDIKSSKELFEINVEHLTKGSHIIIDISCDYCGEVLHIPYRRYVKYTKVFDKYSCSKIECSNQKIKDVCLTKYGVENPFQADFVKEKSKKTFNDRYGVNHQMEIQEVKDKIKKTCLERYDDENFRNIDKRRITCIEKYGVIHENMLEVQKDKRKTTRIKKGTQLPDNLLEPYFLYRRQVDNISDKLKFKLLEIWDGYDYYDNEYIKDNFNLKPSDKNYPTIDHKISVRYGFLNNFSIEDVSSINNLCFTKNKLNSQKGSLNEEQYKKKKESF